MFLTTVLLSQFLISTNLVNTNKSYPNLVGGSGTLRTFSAVPNEPSTFGVQLLTNFFTSDPFINARKHSRNQLRVNGNYTFDWGFPIELFSGFTFSFNENSNSAQSRTTTTFFENLDLGARFGKAMSSTRHWYMGGYGYIRTFSGTRTMRNTSGGSKIQGGPVVSGTLGFANSYDLTSSEGSVPLRHHVNLAYRLPNGDLSSPTDDFNRFAIDSYKYHALVASTSIEHIQRYFKSFIEYSVEYALFTGRDTVDFLDNRQKLTVGTRITPMESFSILAAGDVGLAGPEQGQATGIPRNPRWDLYIGLAFQTVGDKLLKKEGHLRGVVTDGNSGTPLSGVSVSVVGESTTPQVTDLAGYYEVQNLLNGSYQVRYEKIGYEPVTKSFAIRDGTDTTLDVALNVAGPKTGNIFGAVIDRETQGPIQKSVISISGLDSQLASDDSGQFKANGVIEGRQTVHVEAPGYIAQDFVVNVLPKQTIQQSFSLQKAPPATGNCAGIVKNKDGTPLTAVFTSTDGTISPFGTNPITGEFSQSMAPGTYKFKVQAENYLPQEVDCEVKPGEKSSLDLTLEKPKEAVVVDDKIILPDAIYFEFGSSVIKSESHSVLDQVAQILTTRDDYKELHVEGHTDNVGGEEPNQKLSKNRSLSVKKYLMSKGIKGEKIKAVGFGKTKPIATNTTAEGRAENRRVEFNIVRKDQ